MRRSLVISLGCSLALLAGPAFAQLPALRDRPLSAVERTRLAAIEGQFIRISAQRNTSVAALRTIAESLGERLTSQDPDQLLRTIEQRAEELSRARARIKALERDLEAVDSMKLAMAVGPLLTDAGRAIDEGRLTEAEAKLTEAGERFGQARTSLQGRVDELAVREADVLAQRAGVRLSLSDYAGAATLLRQAATTTPAADTTRRWEYFMREAEALSVLGLDGGEPAALQQAAAVYERDALPLVSRDKNAKTWAETQTAFGNLLARMGERGNDGPTRARAIVMLREVAAAPAESAVARERKAWLASALAFDAFRRSDAAQSQEAVALFREADAAGGLPSTRLRQNFANALVWLSSHKMDPVTLGEAERVLEAAAQTVDRKGSPRNWAQLASARATTLSIRYDATKDPADLERSLAIEREILTVATREQTPALWARTHMSLGTSLMKAGQAEGAAGGPRLAEAEKHLRTAGELITRDGERTLWTGLQYYLAATAFARAQLTTDSAKAQEAVAALRTQLAALDKASSPGIWMESQATLGDWLTETARWPGADRSAALDAARAAYADTLAVAEGVNHGEFKTRAAAGLAKVDAARTAAPA